MPLTEPLKRIPTRRRSIILLICVIGLVVGMAPNYRLFLPNLSGNTPNSQSSGNTVPALANWSILAYTTEELYDTADVIVRGNVVATRNRVLTETLQVHGLTGDAAKRAEEVPELTLVLEKGMRERGMEGAPDDLTPEQQQAIMAETNLETKPIREETLHTALTDTTIEVMEVLKGDVNKTIMITQAGGEMPAPSYVEGTHTVNMEFVGSPLLQMGEEYILFLTHRKVDAHEVDTLGLNLYELPSPTGQFRISGDAVTNTGDVHAAANVDGEHLNQLPTDLNTLLVEIQQLSESQ